MVFYNLVFYRGDHWHESNKPNGGRDNRYLIIASNRSKADLLYRVLQENKALTGGRKFHEMKRLSPQMWSWCGDGPRALYDAIEKINIGTADVAHAETKDIMLTELRGHVFFQFLDAWDTLSLGFPVLRADDGDIADRVNGGRFCVKSRRWPGRFWALHRGSNSCAIVVSECEKAVFRIWIERREREVAETDGAEKDGGGSLLMTDWDRVRVCVVTEEGERVLARKTAKSDGNVYLHFDDGADEELGLTLGGLLHGDVGISPVRRLEADGEMRMHLFPFLVERSFQRGEDWELVDG